MSDAASAFVLMPFRQEFQKVYTEAIKPACERAGATCSRVDEQIFTENILLRIYDQIRAADVIVAEMTGRNPNVFYETGYAHALNKRVLLLTQKVQDIPFDLAHYPHIVYEADLAKLADELERRVHWAITHPKAPLQVDPLITSSGSHKLEPEDVAILAVLARRSGMDVLDLEILGKRAKVPSEVTRIALDRLRSSRMVEKRSLLGGGYRLTQSGLAALREHESRAHREAASDPSVR